MHNETGTFIPANSTVYQYLYRFHAGRCRPVKAKDLAIRFNTDLRAVNEEIRQLRKAGILIGSSKDKPCGYYIPVTEQEIKKYLGTYRDELFDMLRIHNIQKRAARKALESIRQPEFKVEAGQLAFI